MFQTWNFKSFPKQTHVKWHTLYCFNVRLAKNILAISVTRKTHLNCGLNDLKPWDPSQQTQELHQESVLRHQHLSLSFKCRFREFKFLHNFYTSTIKNLYWDINTCLCRREIYFFVILRFCILWYTAYRMVYIAFLKRVKWVRIDNLPIGLSSLFLVTRI